MWKFPKPRFFRKYWNIQVKYKTHKYLFEHMAGQFTLQSKLVPRLLD